MPCKIMIVDDEQNIRDIISEFLSETGYSVAVAVDGVDALEKVQYEQYDLYIIDVYMPRMDGLELLVKLKELQPLAVVIVTTGFSSIDVAIKAIRNGAYHYLTKPIQAEELLKVVESGLEHSIALGEIPAPQSIQAEPSPEGADTPLLRGFSKDQQQEFYSIGCPALYKEGDEIPLKDDPGSMIWIERGRVGVYHNNALVETLKGGDIWGEETLFNTGAVFINLRAQQEVQLRHFSRRKLIEFFSYQEETLTKRYMINLIQSIYSKWRRTIFKLGLYSGFVPQEKHR
ncbi:MAG TPA: response regulator [Candidatus Cloacimonadota bacterium]|nr:response regulator [Candidatus Cloacimonadota bacterium]